MKIKNFLKGEWKIVGSVLKPSKKGKWDDFAAVTPVIFKHPLKKEGYIMYHMGQSCRNRNWSIGYAESDNLLKWKKYNKPIIHYKDKKNIYQTDGPYLVKYKRMYYLFCEERSYTRTLQHNIKDVIKQFIPSFARKILWKIDRLKRDSLNISRYIEHSSNRYIIRFSSNNPLKWDVSGKQIVASKANIGTDICSPKIYNFKGRYYLLASIFDGKTKTILSEIKNPLKLGKINLNVIVEPGKQQDWDSAGVIMASILELEDGYVGFYEARDKKEIYRIGIAYSYDLKDWEKFKGNPIIEIGKKGNFYDRMICAPYIFQDRGKIYLFFTAYDWKMNNCIALAEFRK